MLRKFSDEIAVCHAVAEDYAQKAAEATTNQERDDYLRLQQHCLTLAHIGERLDDFLKENARHGYRLFLFNQDGQITGPPLAISAAGDDDALAKAEAIRGSFAAELLNVHSMRIVRCLPRTRKWAA